MYENVHILTSSSNYKPNTNVELVVKTKESPKRSEVPLPGVPLDRSHIAPLSKKLWFHDEQPTGTTNNFNNVKSIKECHHDQLEFCGREKTIAK